MSKLPKLTLKCLINKREYEKKTADLFKGNVLLIGLVGQATVKCCMSHLPGYVKNYDSLMAEGFDRLVYVSTDDLKLLGTLAEDAGVDGKGLVMLSDPDGAIADSLGLKLEVPTHGLGTGCNRFAAIVKNGEVLLLRLDKKGEMQASSAEEMLKTVRAMKER